MADIDSKAKEKSPSGVIYLMEVILQRRKFIFWSIVLSIIASTAVAFLITPKFKSVASVFPAEKTDLLGSMEGISSIARTFSPTRGLAALTGRSETDRYMAILKSSRVIDAVIEKFDLVHVYNITSYPGERTAKELLDNVEFEDESEGDLSITVYDEDPQRAAAMANYFVDLLNKTNAEIGVQNARANREFIEERYNKNLKDLAASEDSLKAFQKRYGVIAMPEQIEASIKAGAELAGQVALKEVQLGVLERMQSAENPSVISTKMEVEELRKKMSQMNTTGVSKEGTKLFVPFDRIPDLGAEYIRRYRDVEIQYKILQFVTPIFEQAKIEERRETPSVIVLDKAGPAERKSKPKRTLIILGGLLVGLVFSVGYASLSQIWRSERELDTAFYRISSALGRAVKSEARSALKRTRKSSPS